MGKIKVHAGDFFTSVKGDFSSGSFYLKSKKHFVFGEKIKAKKKLASLELANEENVISAGGTVGWGVTGAVLLGPVGLLAGLLLGGKKKKVTFVATFHDGRKLLATTDSKTYNRILTEYMKRKV